MLEYDFQKQRGTLGLPYCSPVSAGDERGVAAPRVRNCIAGAMLLALGTAGCEQKNAFVPPPPPKVTVARPVVQPVVDWIEFTGSTKATATVELRSRVGGYLQRIAFEDGANVTAGDLLLVIEQEPFQVALETAKANLARAQAVLQLAEANLARSKQLAAESAISKQQLDVDEAERATAVANVKAAESAIRQAELNLRYTEIRAPITGRIGRRLVDVGNLVDAEQTLMAVIESIDPIYAYFYLSERDLLRFMQMQRDRKLPNPDENPPTLYLGLENEPDFPHEGHLDFRELGVDPGTGTAFRRGIFPNPGQALIPGLFVRVRGAIGQPKPRMLVEERAIGTDQRGEYLLVVNDKQEVEYHPVKLGSRVGNLRVVHEGVQQRDRIIVNGLQRARPGARSTPNSPQPLRRQPRGRLRLPPRSERCLTDEPGRSDEKTRSEAETPAGQGLIPETPRSRPPCCHVSSSTARSSPT